MSEQKRLTNEERQQAIEAVAAVLRGLPDSLMEADVADIAEAALRQVVRCHVVVQTARMVTGGDYRDSTSWMLAAQTPRPL